MAVRCGPLKRAEPAAAGMDMVFCSGLLNGEILLEPGGSDAGRKFSVFGLARGGFTKIFRANHQFGERDQLDLSGCWRGLMF